MQIVYKDEDEKDGSRGASLVGTIICAGRISRHLEGECLGEFGGGETRV